MKKINDYCLTNSFALMSRSCVPGAADARELTSAVQAKCLVTAGMRFSQTRIDVLADTSGPSEAFRTLAGKKTGSVSTL